MTTKLPNYYDEKYFRERDHLDIHLAEAIKIFMDENSLKRVLDVGCGTGRLVKFLNEEGFEAMGCDNQETAVKYAKKLIKNAVVKASATKLPFKKGSFDLVCCVSVLEHLIKKDTKKFLTEAKRVLAPNGFVLLVTPNFATPLRYIQGERWFGYSDPTHVNFFTPGKLSGLLRSYGFINVKLHFKTKYTSSFDWDLPGFTHKFPRPLKNFITYLLISTPFSNIRNSFWIAAQKT